MIDTSKYEIELNKNPRNVAVYVLISSLITFGLFYGVKLFVKYKKKKENNKNNENDDNVVVDDNVGIGRTNTLTHNYADTFMDVGKGKTENFKKEKENGREKKETGQECGACPVVAAGKDVYNYVKGINFNEYTQSSIYAGYFDKLKDEFPIKKDSISKASFIVKYILWDRVFNRALPYNFFEPITSDEWGLLVNYTQNNEMSEDVFYFFVGEYINTESEISKLLGLILYNQIVTDGNSQFQEFNGTEYDTANVRSNVELAQMETVTNVNNNKDENNKKRNKKTSKKQTKNNN
ncbi:MAG: hypothetical protein KatS3mg096_576 [Candidatus Parcubacteria bacterium]|nr:MAG: hypothetical protein KatS3mg096_576 [Candidatus Parcubacteria bacterium]